MRSVVPSLLTKIAKFVTVNAQIIVENLIKLWTWLYLNFKRYQMCHLISRPKIWLKYWKMHILMYWNILHSSNDKFWSAQVFIIEAIDLKTVPKGSFRCKTHCKYFVSSFQNQSCLCHFVQLWWTTLSGMLLFPSLEMQSFWITDT